MSETTEAQDDLADDWLWLAADVQEQPFSSNTPVVGRLLAGLRDAWSRVADRPYVRPLRRRQNELNRLLVQQMAEIDLWLLVQDRKRVACLRETALLASRVRHLHRRLREAEASLRREEQP
jgi:hypothetical protein